MTPTTRLEATRLETREMPAVLSEFMSGSTWVVNCDDAATNLTVSTLTTGDRSNPLMVHTDVRIRDTVSGQTWLRSAGSVSRVELHGGASNDQFTTTSTFAKPVSFYGGGGNDYLQGGAAGDILEGEAGNDTELGGGGDDTVYGSGGDDILLGQGGSDVMYGGDGNDRLNGGDAADTLYGNNGDDVLVTLNRSGLDVADGGAGRDAFWADPADTLNGVTVEDAVQRVADFANQADRSLNGDNIADPTANAAYSLRNFANDLKTNSHPLFPSTGPKMDDIRQGQEGDCWVLAGLGAIAKDSPNALRQRVVDFDDGTYGVKLGNNFYRVDADLPVFSGTSTPAYAKLGAQGSMWVAVVEKAYAYYRTGANSYASLNGGWSVDVNRAFGSTSAGYKNIDDYSSASALVNDMYSRWSTRQAVTVGILSVRDSSAAAGARLVMQHMYTVSSFVRDVHGAIIGVVLRNPWGTDGVGSDGSNDGYVTVTPAQLFAHDGAVNWGKV